MSFHKCYLVAIQIPLNRLLRFSTLSWIYYIVQLVDYKTGQKTKPQQPFSDNKQCESTTTNIKNYSKSACFEKNITLNNNCKQFVKNMSE